MDLDELQSVRDRERQTDQLQQLRESFYADAGSFVTDLRDERDRVAERVDDPYAPEATRLNNEIETAIQLVEDIQEGRIGKIVKAASLDAAGLPANVEGMTAEEQDLFDTLVQDIRDHRNRVLGIVEDEGTTLAQDTAGGSAEAGTEREHPAALEDPVPGVEGSAAAESAPASTPGEVETSPSDDEMVSEEKPSEQHSEAPTAGSPDQHTETGSDESGDEPQSIGDEGPAAGETPAAGAMGGSPETTTSQTGETSSTAETASPTAATEDQPDSLASTGTSSDGSGEGATRPQMDSVAGGSTGTDGANGAPSESHPDRQHATETSTESGSTQTGGSVGTSESAASAESAETEAVDRTRVLLTDDVDTFVGFDDCDYDLEATDVVALPSTNADILVDRGVARRLSPK